MRNKCSLAAVAAALLFATSARAQTDFVFFFSFGDSC